MPAKPVWYHRWDEILQQLQASPRSFVDRATVEFVLGVGRRRAQQIMAPCITDHVGSSGLADRNRLIVRLRKLAEGEDAGYEVRRRRKVAAFIDQVRNQRLAHPQVLVEAPVRMLAQELDHLPAGIRLEPGRITVEFASPQQALEKLLALAIAIGNDFARFEHTTRPLAG
jgi:hypothetical protein